jgi:hypothetical protein
MTLVFALCGQFVLGFLTLQDKNTTVGKYKMR